MGNDNILAIVATECRVACEGEPDLEKRVRKAMAEVKDGHWMVGKDDDLCFRGAIGGVLMAPETTDEDKERITHTLNGLRSLSALMSGVPVDMDALAKQQEESPTLPLVKWWHEVKAA